MPAMAYPTGMLQVDLDGYPANRQYHPTFPLYTPPYSSLLLRTPSVHEGMIQYDNLATSVNQPGTTYPRAHHRTQHQQQQQQQQQPPLGNSQLIQDIQKSQFSHIPHSIVPNYNHPYWAFSRDPSHATMGRLGMIVPPSGSWRESSQPMPDPTNMTLGSHPPAQHGHDTGGRATGVQTQQRGYSGQKYGHPTQPQPLIEPTPGPIHEAVRSVDLQESQFPIVPNILPTVPPVGMRPQSWKWAVVRITNIPWDISLQDMAAFFAGFPMPPEHLLPQHVHILMDRSTGKTFNSAFVELAMTPQQAGLVAQSRNFKVLKGRLVTVELSSQDELLRSIFPKWTGQFIQGEPVLHLQQQDGSKTIGSTTGTGVGRGKGAASATAVSTSTMSTSNANHTGPGSTGGSNSSGHETVRPVKSVGGMENVDDDPPKMESSRPLSTSVSNSTLASSYDSINKYAAPQEAPTPSPTHSTSQSMLFASDPATPPFVTRDEINALLVVCRNYKLHFSRKCAERPFENILSIITKYPWHQPQLVLPLHRDHIFELLKLSIESLRVHLSKDFHTIHPTLLERMVRCAILTPAFTERQKAMVLHVAGCPCPENLLPWMSPPPSTQQQQQQVLQKHQSLSPNAPAETSATAAPAEPTGMLTKPVTTSTTTAKLQPSSQDVALVRETPSDVGPAQASILATNQEGLRTFTRGSKQEKSLGKDASKEASDVEAVIERLSVMGMSKKASSSSGTMKSPQEQASTLTSTPPLSQSSSSSSSPASVQHTKQNINNNDNFRTTASNYLKSTHTSWATIAAPNAAKRGVVEPATSHSSDTPSSSASMPFKTSWDTTLTGTQATMVPPPSSSSSSFRTTAAAHSSQPPLSSVVGETAEATLSVTKACPNISHAAIGTDDGEERGGGARNHLFRGGSRGASQKEGSLRDTASSASSSFSLGSVTGAPPSSLTSSPPSSTSSSSESLLWAIKNITQSTPRLTRSASQAK
ncbi:hypothetical protein BGW42_005255 [Actinomortierella wolfii]|nr:hypothetical protein BGW42_005255 [Actinomortierella wolfii]